MRKPTLSFAQIVAMNFGFFGIQFSFGLQQSNMSPIYRYLGADEASLPYLWLAGPMTGLLVQPIIGALSDRTLSRWGRRTPYFLIGAIICSLALLAMPHSPTLWMAASLLWILDAANNVTMEPYRAFVADRLDPPQHALGYLMQSGFTGLGQTLAYLAPALFVLIGFDVNAVNGHNIPLVTIAAFTTGAVFSIGSILITLLSTRELPLSTAEQLAIAAAPRGWHATLAEIVDGIRTMPPTMRQLFPVCLCQWYALFCYWQYIALSLSRTLFVDVGEPDAALRAAGLAVGTLGGFYNAVAFVAAFAMVPLTRRLGPKPMHAICLALAGAGMLAIPAIDNQTWLYPPMIGIGLAWASIMGNPYVMLAGSVPSHRTGLYMGLFNLFIVIPMLIQIATLPLLYAPLLDSRPENVIRLAGALLLIGALAVLRVRTPALAGAGR